MMQSMRQWWNNHSEGEQRFMTALGLIIALVIFWLGLWRPINGAVDSGWERQRAALDRYSSVQAKVDAIRKLPAKGSGGANVPIDQLVGQSAAEAGFTLDRAAAQGDGRMAITISSARMPALMGWLAGLEAAGVPVETISIAPGPSEGTVSVQAVLREAGR